MFPSDDHRRAWKTIAREQRRRAGTNSRIDYGQIKRGIFYADVFGQRQKSLRMVKFSGLTMRGSRLGFHLLDCSKLLFSAPILAQSGKRSEMKRELLAAMEQCLRSALRKPRHR